MSHKKQGISRIHHTDEVQELCDAAGVKVMFLPPYSPDLNPIEEFFPQLKAWVRRKMRTMNPEEDFAEFLEAFIYEIGSDVISARGHFRNPGIAIKV